MSLINVKKKNVKYTGDFPNGEWRKKEYNQNGQIIYSEDSDGYWHKLEYDKNGRLIYYENSYESWGKWEYDNKGQLIHWENSDGDIIDNRSTGGISEGLSLLGCLYESLNLPKKNKDVIRGHIIEIMSDIEEGLQTSFDFDATEFGIYTIYLSGFLNEFDATFEISWHVNSPDKINVILDGGEDPMAFYDNFNIPIDYRNAGLTAKGIIEIIKNKISEI